ncbi:MAG: HypC/HybG/HupF family hydrogenase formation chaperone [Acidimicrobiales bacterium]|nr:HypC/HybG/HupF family hydrogenase formation chaperone [Acidimicrobiales bacterium]
MCLGLPGRLVDTTVDRGTPMGVVDFGGATRSVCLTFTPEAEPGQYVIVHAGVAIAILDEAAAAESLDLFAEMGLTDPDSARGMA